MKTIKFRDDMIELIKSGRKTQTRRPYVKNKAPKGFLGELITIEGTDTVIKITHLGKELLHDIKWPDYDREGVRIGTTFADMRDYHRIAFIDLWDEFYGDTKYKWEDNPVVWVYEFEVVK